MNRASENCVALSNIPEHMPFRVKKKMVEREQEKVLEDLVEEYFQDLVKTST